MCLNVLDNCWVSSSSDRMCKVTCKGTALFVFLLISGAEVCEELRRSKCHGNEHNSD